MKLLLDTHAALWWWQDSPRLSTLARAMLADPSNTISFSAVSAMEIATKVRLGKLVISGRLAGNLTGAAALSGWTELPITLRHAERAGKLEWAHRDPFDRLLAAQAQLETLTLVTIDAAFKTSAVTTLWDSTR